MMDRGGEPLETYILVSLPKHRTNEQKLKRAEEIIATIQFIISIIEKNDKYIWYINKQ